MTESSTGIFLDRFRNALAARSGDQVAECFAADCRFEVPVHPARNFVGREQARQNWTAIFDAVSDFSATLLSESHTGNACWAEWEYSGTRRDSSAHRMRGATIFEVDDAGRLRSGRIYMEFVDTDTTPIGEHLQRLMGTTT
jgi:ketosteroid isomerase-like protein